MRFRRIGGSVDTKHLQYKRCCVRPRAEERLASSASSSTLARPLSQKRTIAEESTLAPKFHRSKRAPPPTPSSPKQRKHVVKHQSRTAAVFAAAGVHRDGSSSTAADLISAVEELGTTQSMKRCHQVLYELQKKGQYQAMLEVFESMKQKGISPNPGTYSLIISAYGSLSDLTNAVQVFEDMKTQSETGVEPHNYRSVIFACVNCGQSAKAHEYVEEMMKADFVSQAASVARFLCNLMLPKWPATVAADLCIAVLDAMNRRDLPPTPLIYKAALVIYANAQQEEKLLKLYEEVKVQQMEGDVNSLDTVMRALGKDPEKLDTLLSLLEDAEKNHVHHDFSTYMTLLRLCAFHRDERRTLIALDKMESKFKPVVSMYNWALVMYVKMYSEKEMSEAWLPVENLIERMEARGIKPDTVTYELLVTICFLNEDPLRAKKFLWEMKQSTVSFNTGGFSPLRQMDAHSAERRDQGGFKDSTFARIEKAKWINLVTDFCIQVAIRKSLEEEKCQDKARKFIEKLNETSPGGVIRLLSQFVEFWMFIGRSDVVNGVLENALQHKRLESAVICSIFLSGFIRHRDVDSVMDLLLKIQHKEIVCHPWALKDLKYLEDCPMTAETRAAIDACLEGITGSALDY